MGWTGRGVEAGGAEVAGAGVRGAGVGGGEEWESWVGSAEVAVLDLRARGVGDGVLPLTVGVGARRPRWHGGWHGLGRAPARARSFVAALRRESWRVDSARVVVEG